MPLSDEEKALLRHVVPEQVNQNIATGKGTVVFSDAAFEDIVFAYAEWLKEYSHIKQELDEEQAKRIGRDVHRILNSSQTINALLNVLPKGEILTIDPNQMENRKTLNQAFSNVAKQNIETVNLTSPEACFLQTIATKQPTYSFKHPLPLPANETNTLVALTVLCNILTQSKAMHTFTTACGREINYEVTRTKGELSLAISHAFALNIQLWQQGQKNGARLELGVATTAHGTVAAVTAITLFADAVRTVQNNENVLTIYDKKALKIRALLLQFFLGKIDQNKLKAKLNQISDANEAVIAIACHNLLVPEACKLASSEPNSLFGQVNAQLTRGIKLNTVSDEEAAALSASWDLDLWSTKRQLAAKKPCATDTACQQVVRGNNQALYAYLQSENKPAEKVNYATAQEEVINCALQNGLHQHRAFVKKLAYTVACCIAVLLTGGLAASLRNQVSMETSSMKHLRGLCGKTLALFPTTENNKKAELENKLTTPKRNSPTRERCSSSVSSPCCPGRKATRAVPPEVRKEDSRDLMEAFNQAADPNPKHPEQKPFYKGSSP